MPDMTPSGVLDFVHRFARLSVTSRRFTPTSARLGLLTDACLKVLYPSVVSQ
jgi:hypothetical protein